MDAAAAAASLSSPSPCSPTSPPTPPLPTVTPAEPAGPDPAFTAALETSVCSASARFDHPPIGAEAPFEGSEPGWCASEYAPLALYSTSELLAKVGVTAEDASSIRYVTFADDLDSCGYNRLEASAIQHLITIENVAKHGGKQGSAGAGRSSEQPGAGRG